MPILQRVLVALDGSETARQAFTLALSLNRIYGSWLLLCSAVDRTAAIAAASTPEGVFPNVETILEQYDEVARSVLSEASSQATAAGARSATMLLDGAPAAAIVACAQESAVDAIVLGTQGKRGLERVFLGSTAEGVLRMADVPTFIVSPAAHPSQPSNGNPDEHDFERILVALDDSDPSDAALDFAVELAAREHARLLCCSVIESEKLLDASAGYGYDATPLLQEMRREAALLIEQKTLPAIDRHIAVDQIITEGKLPDAILDTAASHRVDLIAIGTHGRRGLRRLMLGSVAENLIRRSVVPVVAVRKA